MADSAGQITERLRLWSRGDEHALDALLPCVYPDLHHIAARLLRKERPGHTLQPTALVNEAYMKLAAARRLEWQNRAHFFAVAARAMRQILNDHARGRKREKRGKGITPVAWDDHLLAQASRQAISLEDLMLVDEALSRLALEDPRRARMVELRFYGGLTNEEIGEVLEISVNTVIRDWDLAQAWMRRELQGSPDRAGVARSGVEGKTGKR